MKSEIQIKRKFKTIKKERDNAFFKLREEKKDGIRTNAVEAYEELIAKYNGFLEALYWIRK